MKQNTKISILVIILAFIGVGLSKIHFPYLQYFSGLLIYFAISFNITLVLESITRTKFSALNLFLWTSLFAVTLNPILYYILYAFKGFGSASLIFSFSMILLSALSLINWTISRLSGLNSVEINFRNILNNKLLLAIIGLFVLGMTVNFFLYKFIPEGDPYFYLINLRKYLANGVIGTEESRPLFIVFMNSLTSLAGISAYWLFKIIIPLLSFPFVLILYKISKDLIKNNYLVALSSLSFLLFPIIMMELLIPRPQSLFLISFPLMLYLLTGIVNQKYNRSIFSIIIIFITQAISLKTHQFFFFGTLISIIALIYYLWPIIKTKIFESLLITIFILFAFYPWIRDLGILTQVTGYIHVFWGYISHPKFDLWFVDSYVNIDGNQMGWTGFMTLFYYGYNIGILLPISILLLIIRRKKIKVKLSENWLYFVAFLLFFSIAELFPRIGLAFLPDRAWLFVSLTLCFFMPFAIKSAFEGFRWASIKIWSIALITLSFMISWGLTYAKQGWITDEEYKAALWAKENTPKNSLFISQPGNFIILQYFAEREIFFADKTDLFTSDTYQQQFINNLPNRMSTMEGLSREAMLIKNQLVENISSLSLDNNAAKNQELAENISQNIKLFNQINSKIPDTKTIKEIESMKIYVLYSHDKFKGLYGARSWWKTQNFFCDAEKIALPASSLVFHDKNVRIWERSTK